MTTLICGSSSGIATAIRRIRRPILYVIGEWVARTDGVSAPAKERKHQSELFPDPSTQLKNVG